MKVLYVWGFQEFLDSPIKKAIEEKLGDMCTICEGYYAQWSPDEAKKDLDEMLREVKPSVVVGHELGAWLASLLDIGNLISIDMVDDPKTWLRGKQFVMEDGESIYAVGDHIVDAYANTKLVVNKSINVTRISSSDDGWLDKLADDVLSLAKQ